MHGAAGRLVGAHTRDVRSLPIGVGELETQLAAEAGLLWLQLARKHNTVPWHRCEQRPAAWPAPSRGTFPWQGRRRRRATAAPPRRLCAGAPPGVVEMLQHGPTSGPPPARASRGPPHLSAPPAGAAPGGILAASWRPRWPTGFDVYRFSEARRRERRQGAHGPRGKALVGGSRRGPPRRRRLVLLPPASCGIVQDGPKQSSEIYSAQLSW